MECYEYEASQAKSSPKCHNTTFQGVFPSQLLTEGFQLWGDRKGAEVPHVTLKMGFSSDSQVPVSGHSIKAGSRCWKGGCCVINLSQHRNKPSKKKLSGNSASVNKAD